MNRLRAIPWAAAPAAVLFACAGHGATGSSSGSGGSAAACPPCMADTDCATGSKCGQFGGDTYCAPDCSTSPTCSSDRACTQVADADGSQLKVCVPITNVCGGGGGASATSSSNGSSSGGTCGSLDGPDVMAACTSCKSANQPCQANGCYGGWWCNVDTGMCQAAPAPGSCGSTSSSSSSSSTSSSTSGGGGSVGNDGGTLPALSFAIIGDTRPPNDDDTAGYPTAVITKIWQDVEAHSPRPKFAVTTGDYMFAKANGSQSGPQLDLYLAARAAFTNVVFPAMGNHECDGTTQDNCPPVTKNYNSFASKMLTPLGQALPYYTIHINGPNNVWTSKFVFVACNYWSATQATWLGNELSNATTYTFVVRHEGSIANTAPCLSGSGANNAGTIMSQHPYTLLIAGHTHTFEYFADEKQVIVGNGGAPLSGNINYGYVIAEQLANGKIQFQEFDYATNAVQTTFVVSP